MWIEFPAPINLSEREYLNMPAEFLSTIVVPRGKVVFAISYPFTNALLKVAEKETPWTMQDVLSMIDVLYTMSYAADDHERVHELVLPCTCTDVLKEEDFAYSRLSETSCRICLSTRMSTKLVLPCGHEFHVRCIRDWFKEQNSCPLCKQPISPCADCDSKRSIEINLTDNQLRQLTGEPRIPTRGPYGIGPLHYEQLYFSAVYVGDVGQGRGFAIKIKPCPDLCR